MLKNYLQIAGLIESSWSPLESFILIFLLVIGLLLLLSIPTSIIINLISLYKNNKHPRTKYKIYKVGRISTLITNSLCLLLYAVTAIFLLKLDIQLMIVLIAIIIIDIYLHKIHKANEKNRKRQLLLQTY